MLRASTIPAHKYFSVSKAWHLVESKSCFLYIGVEDVYNSTKLNRLVCTIHIYFLKSSYFKDTTLC